MNQLSLKKMNQITKKKKKGFTLVELIIVIAIIAVLAAIAIPKFGAIRENANIKADMASAKNIQTAVTTAIANGDVILDANGDNTSLSLGSLLDGNVPTVKSNLSGHKGENFTATVDNNVVIVTAGTKTGAPEVFPTPGTPYNS